MPPSEHASPTPPRGHVIPIGGAEDKERDLIILRRFTRLCGGRAARIAVIPTASQESGTGRRYVELFRGLGVPTALSMPIDSRKDAERVEWLTFLDDATGVFLTGGNQLRLSTVLGGTAVFSKLRQRHGAGMHVAGTSAGAAFLSEHMIAYGAEGGTPRADMVTLAAGLGLLTGAIVDQHFRQRDRIGRLLAALAFNPSLVGLGLDEDTAVFVAPDDSLEVVGSGAVTVVDPGQVGSTNMDSVARHDPVSLINLRVHILVHGGGYHLRTREARAGATLAERNA